VSSRILGTEPVFAEQRTRRRTLMNKVVLAYSGGLDTSVAIRWIQENYNAEVIAVAVDIGEEKDYAAIQKKATDVGAVSSRLVDAKEEFVRDFVFPALKANAVYENKYLLATAIARPLIAKIVTQVAQEEGADTVAHGATGKGNDQVRFEVSFGALNPSLKVVAPAREWGMTREEEIEYARRHGIPVPVDVDSPYSVDVNLWGRSIECGVLEDPSQEPPEEVFQWTVSPQNAPDTPTFVEIGFEKGIPVSLNGRRMDGVALIEELNKIGGANGVGRVDMMENRLVGIKSREIYECPAGTILTAAHREIEALTIDRETMHFKQLVELKFSELAYYGLWFSDLQKAIAAFIDTTQENVTGNVTMKLFKGSCTVAGRRSPHSLYSYEMATYDKADAFDHTAGRGFCEIFGLPLKVAARLRKR
jgi:argininosuccinate synthase